MNILFVGDIVGRPGRNALARWLPELCEEFAPGAVVVNGENAAGGLGATPAILDALFETGADVITMGNHTWRKKELAPRIDSIARVVRPANYAPGTPGMGAVTVETRSGATLGVISLLGRVYMEPVDCPFRVGKAEVSKLREQTPLILVDIHAEATSEKVALGWYLDGLCTAVVGTHTHVQTADERILPGGTAYITDVGMTGPFDSVIGVERELVVHKFVTGMPTEFRVAEERPGLCGVVIEVDPASGRARSIRRIMRVEA